VLSGVSQASAQRRANAANRAIAAENQAAQERLWRLSRGEDVTKLGTDKDRFSNVMLPFYARDAEGRMIEPELMREALIARNIGIEETPEAQAAKYFAIRDRLSPFQADAEAAALSILGPGYEGEKLRFLAPVEKAMEDVTESRVSAAQEAIERNLGIIKANQMRKGFSGDSLADSRVRGDALLQMLREAGMERSLTRLNIEKNRADVRNRAHDLRVANLNLPMNVARSAAGFVTLPNMLAQEDINRRNQNLNWFRMGPSQPGFTPMPPVGPITGTGEILGNAMSSAGSALGSFGAAKYAAQQQGLQTERLMKLQHNNDMALQRSWWQHVRGDGGGILGPSYYNGPTD
jgi:hypothetical protein